MRLVLKISKDMNLGELNRWLAEAGLEFANDICKDQIDILFLNDTNAMHPAGDYIPGHDDLLQVPEDLKYIWFGAQRDVGHVYMEYATADMIFKRGTTFAVQPKSKPN